MRIELKYGVIVTLANIGVLVIEGLSDRIGFDPGTHTWYLGIVFVPLIIFLGMREKRVSNPDASYPYAKAFGTGFLITLFCSIFTAGLTFIYVQFFDTERQARIIEGTRQNLIASGAAESQLTSQISSLQFITSPVAMTFGALIMMMMAGLFFSSISAVLARKKEHVQATSTS